MPSVVETSACHKVEVHTSGTCSFMESACPASVLLDLLAWPVVVICAGQAQDSSCAAHRSGCSPGCGCATSVLAQWVWVRAKLPHQQCDLVKMVEWWHSIGDVHSALFVGVGTDSTCSLRISDDCALSTLWGLAVHGNRLLAGLGLKVLWCALRRWHGHHQQTGVRMGPEFASLWFQC